MATEVMQAQLGHLPTPFLRENLQTSWDKTSLQRLSCNLPLDLSLTSAKEVGDAKWELEFSDGAKGLFVLPPSPEESLSAKPRELWNDPNVVDDLLQKDFSQGGLRFDWKDLGFKPQDDDRVPEQLGQGRALLAREVAVARAALLERIHEWGIAVIKHAPTEPNQGRLLCDELVGAVETTNFGYSFTIKSVAEPHNLAFARLHIQHHTDFTYCAKVPDIAAFHCIRPAPQGGNSLWLDAFSLAEEFRAENPRQFDLLAKTDVLHMDITDKWVLEAKHPTFELGPDGKSVSRVHFNERTRDSWRQFARGEPLSPEFYAALRNVETMVEDKARHLETPLQAGDIVLFDNARVMHSRTAFTGERWMEGVYFDWSAALATWRSLQYTIKDKPFVYCGVKVGK